MASKCLGQLRVSGGHQIQNPPSVLLEHIDEKAQGHQNPQGHGQYQGVFQNGLPTLTSLNALHLLNLLRTGGFVKGG